jgi:nicotinamidase/pyrazinamidase
MNALILVDLQNDFLPGGALAVPRGDEVIPQANVLQERFDLVVATQDWHPPDHVSFAVNHPGQRVGDVFDLDGQPQVLWPVHCVQRTHGAELAESLNKSKIAHLVYKGADPKIDSYSGFFDNGHLRSTGLTQYLRERRVGRTYVLGLATDYCVKATALDAVGLGFETFLIADACRGVDLVAGDVERAIDDMRQQGVQVIQSADVRSEVR